MAKTNIPVSLMTVENLKTILKENNFKPAKNLKEIGERVAKKHPNVTSHSAKYSEPRNYLLNLKDIFLETPELFLFNDVEAELTRQYMSLFTRVSSRLDTFQNVVSNMRKAVLNIYKNLFEIYDVKDTDIEEKHKFLEKVKNNSFKETKKVMLIREKENGEEAVKRQKSKFILTKRLKETFKDDVTPIENFIDKDDENAEALLNYLIQVKKVHTLGEFFTKISDKRESHNIFGRGYRYKTAYMKFLENVKSYITKHDKNITKNSLQNLRTENFIEYLSNLPAELFRKGSESMKQINAVKTEYVKKVSKEYINKFDDLNETDVVEVMNSEYRKINAIIDEKRDELKKQEEEAAKETKKAELIAFAAKKAAEEEEYKVKPDMFNKELGTHKDKFAGKLDRSL